MRCRPSCDNERTRQQAFCRSCWFSLPKPLRDEIWHLYRHEPGSRNHLETLAQAQRILEGRSDTSSPVAAS
jgi:hypothetical protein